MKTLGFLLLMSNLLFSMEYYSKLEPINTYVVKSSVSGKVIYANENLEGKLLSKKEKIVEIDWFLNDIELKETLNKIEILDEMIKIQDKNYKRLNQISSKSAYEKDNQKIQVLNLKSSKSDLIIKKESLKDTIKNKTFYEKDLYISTISIKKDDYVNPGTLLYETKDFSKGKLEIFIPINEYTDIQNKTIYLDGKKSDLTINKIYKVADTKHISSYKCEIIVPNPKTFSRLIKIEFK